MDILQQIQELESMVMGNVFTDSMHDFNDWPKGELADYLEWLRREASDIRHEDAWCEHHNQLFNQKHKQIA